MATDLSHRFIFNQTDVRGDIVRMEQSFHDLIAGHDYPPVVANLLGEFLAAAVLLGNTIKFTGRLILQARSEGAVSMLMAEVTHDRKVRGVAQLAGGADAGASDFSELLRGGTLAVTVEPDAGQRYQSLVPMSGGTLGECLEHYFSQSEQLNTFIRLAADGAMATGILVQQLPPQLVPRGPQRDEDWNRLHLLAETLTPGELLSLDHLTVLSRLFAQEDIKLLDERPVAFECRCSEARMANALVALGETEINAIFADKPEVTLTCEICKTERSFGQAEISAMLDRGTVH
ncbi:MAG: Hsp33 family molecular chaperone HslO [Proteobacteria bacterium]|jgi:molecular chaperone Hsp33|nr:Hsp33 family molecular chaperone HslO [Pseudomonadota bacterium]MDA1302175.1 Hsp33 family molecular chaperone HslO [Pseudomonadota bacterium]